MKNFILCIVSLICVSGCMTIKKAVAPEKMVSKYYESVVINDMESITVNMHPDELIKFKNMMQPVFLSLMKESDRLAPLTFTRGESIEKIELDTPEQFFTRFMGFYTTIQPGIKDVVQNSTIETLGHVKEGDLAHVVLRMTSSLKKSEVVRLLVFSLKKDRDEWKTMLTGEVKDFARMIKRRNR